MRKYPKNRKPCGYAICEICGRMFIARGLGTHKREAHKIVVRNVDYYSNNATITRVTGKPTHKNESHKNDEILPKTVSCEVISELLPSENFDRRPTCNRGEQTRLYTDHDLWILFGRMRLVFYSSYYPPDIMRYRLIEDFEERFECDFNEVKRANPHICPDKEFAKGHDLAFELAGMEYSR